MCRLLETIRIRNRQPENLEYHQKRVDESRQKLFGFSDRIDLCKVGIPSHLSDAIHKCRIIYQRGIERIEFLPYSPKIFRILKLVEAPLLSYPFKFAARRCFSDLLELHSDTDEIIIVQQGRITDSTFSNLAFHDGSRWYTPSAPLLKGTCRQRLLDQGRITEAPVAVTDLFRFNRLSLINALNDLEEISFPFIFQNNVFLVNQTGGNASRKKAPGRRYPKD